MATVLASDADMLEQIEAFCTSNEMSVTTFGRKAIGDANLIANLRADRSLTLKTAHRIVDFMAGYRAGSAQAVAA